MIKWWNGHVCLFVYLRRFIDSDWLQLIGDWFFSVLLLLLLLPLLLLLYLLCAFKHRVLLIYWYQKQLEHFRGFENMMMFSYRLLTLLSLVSILRSHCTTIFFYWIKSQSHFEVYQWHCLPFHFLIAPVVIFFLFQLIRIEKEFRKSPEDSPRPRPPLKNPSGVIKESWRICMDPLDWLNGIKRILKTDFIKKK